MYKTFDSSLSQSGVNPLKMSPFLLRSRNPDILHVPVPKCSNSNNKSGDVSYFYISFLSKLLLLLLLLLLFDLFYLFNLNSFVINLD